MNELQIFIFYNAPYSYKGYLYRTILKEFKNINIDEVLQFLTAGKELWTYRASTTIPETFNQELIMPKAKIWMKFVCSRICSTTYTSKICPIHAILMYGILKKKRICIRKWIYMNMVECAKNLGKRVFFLHLITEMCKKARVPMKQLDRTMDPLSRLLGVDMFAQFTLLQRKQFEERRSRGLNDDDDEWEFGASFVVFLRNN